MRALNQAFEDAAAFTSFRDALTARSDVATDAQEQLAPIARLPGENRADYRRRMRALRKVAKSGGKARA